MNQENAGGLELFFPFTSDDPLFTQGFECGMLHLEMLRGDPEVKRYCHAENVEQIRIMAEAQGYIFTCGNPVDNWTLVTLKKKPELVPYVRDFPVCNN